MNLFPGVLLVDDDEDYLYVARRAIERAKLHADVRVTRDGDEALRVLGLQPGGVEPEAPHTVVVVLLDLRMPGPGGYVADAARYWVELNEPPRVFARRSSPPQTGPPA